MPFLIPTAGDFFDRYELRFKLSSHAGSFEREKHLYISEVQRPGLALGDYFEDREPSTLFIFGKAEFDYLLSLTAEERVHCLQKAITTKTPVVIIAGNLAPIEELVGLCREKKVLLLCSQLKAKKLLVELSLALAQDFCPHIHCHGTLVEIYGTGVVIEGEAGIGKSETALELVAKGHRLIADDRVFIQRKSSNQLIGKGSELSRYLLEMRGIGVVNVAHLYGTKCVRDEVVIDLVVRFEEWDRHHFCDAIGLKEQFKEFLGINIPFYVLPVRPERNLALLTEAIALNHRAKSMGHHAAKEFHFKLSREIAKQK